MNSHDGTNPSLVATSRRRSAWQKLLSRMASVGGVLLYVLAFAVTIDVTYRWFMGRPIAGVFELSEVLLVAVTFLAIAGVQASGKQLSVDILTADVKGRKKVLLRILDAVAAFLFFAVLLWTGVIDLWESVRMGLQGSGIVKIPTAIPLGLVVFGTLIMVITLVIELWRDTRFLTSGDDQQGTNRS